MAGTKFGRLASTSENKYWQILIWQMAEIDLYSLTCPKSAVHTLEVAEGSGLQDQSNSIAEYKGIMFFNDIGTPTIGERLPCTEREIEKA